MNKTITLASQSKASRLYRDTSSFNLMDNSSRLLCTKGYYSSIDFRHYLESTNQVTFERIKRYSLVLDNKAVFPLCLEDMIDSKPIYKDYPYLFRASTHHKAYKAKHQEVIGKYLLKLGKELNKGISIVIDSKPIHLSKLHTINGVMPYSVPLKVTFNKIIYSYTDTEDKIVNGMECKSKNQVSTNTGEFDEDVVMSRQLGNLYPMHKAYFEDTIKEVKTYTPNEVDSDNTDASYWNSILSDEGLSTHMDGVVAVASFNGEESATFKEGVIIKDGERVTPTKEDRQEHIESVRVSKNNMLKASRERARRKASKNKTVSKTGKKSMSILDYI